MNGRGHAEEAPLAGRHEEVVGVQDARVGQQKVLQFHVLVLAPEGKGHVNQYSLRPLSYICSTTEKARNLISWQYNGLTYLTASFAFLWEMTKMSDRSTL